MSITIAGIFAKAWRREQFGLGQRLLRGATWFVLYLTMIALRERIAFGGDHSGAIRALLFVAALVPVWIFWSLTPVLLVRDGGRGLRYLALAGLAGVVIDGTILPLAARILFPPLLIGWNGLRPNRCRDGIDDVVRGDRHRMGVDSVRGRGPVGAHSPVRNGHRFTDRPHPGSTGRHVVPRTDDPIQRKCCARTQPIPAVTTFAETWLAGPRFEPGGLSPTGLQSADGGSTDVAV